MISDLEPVFRAAHLQLKPRTAVPKIHVEFFPFAGLNHTARFRRERLLIRVSDLFTDAPHQVIHSLALILLAKLYRKKIDDAHHQTYRGFTLGAEIQERAREARTARGRAPQRTEPYGRYRNLELSFDRLNTEYFGGSLDRPQLSWSAKRSRHTLGRYASTYHTIFISRVFDSNTVPEYVLDYVMFHEMLHVKHPTRVQGRRVVAHTTEFRADERQFHHYIEAKEWLKRI